tara:strand:- start:3011 stop:3751 length:741 start_codon:yes stop_codon:yes gene_type:complete
MALIEELNAQGNKLFKHRSKLPIPFAVIGLALYIYTIYFGNEEEHTLAFEISCLAVGLLGQLIRAITLGYTPRGTSGRNTDGQVAESLNTKGMYSIMRNPLYLGNFFMWFAIILFININWFSIFYIMCFWMYYERIIFAEENFLRNKYGEPYVNWTLKTPIFLPRLSGWKKPDLFFSFKNVLKREYSGFFALFFTFTLFDLVENFARHSVWELDPFWIYALLTSGIITLILRTLKKKTKILNVSGR